MPRQKAYKTPGNTKRLSRKQARYDLQQEKNLIELRKRPIGVSADNFLLSEYHWTAFFFACLLCGQHMQQANAQIIRRTAEGSVLPDAKPEPKHDKSSSAAPSMLTCYKYGIGYTRAANVMKSSDLIFAEPKTRGSSDGSIFKDRHTLQKWHTKDYTVKTRNPWNNGAVTTYNEYTALQLQRYIAEHTEMPIEVAEAGLVVSSSSQQLQIAAKEIVGFKAIRALIKSIHDVNGLHKLILENSAQFAAWIALFNFVGDSDPNLGNAGATTDPLRFGMLDPSNAFMQGGCSRINLWKLLHDKFAISPFDSKFQNFQQQLIGQVKEISAVSFNCISRRIKKSYSSILAAEQATEPGAAKRNFILAARNETLAYMNSQHKSYKTIILQEELQHLLRSRQYEESKQIIAELAQIDPNFLAAEFFPNSCARSYAEAVESPAYKILAGFDDYKTDQFLNFAEPFTILHHLVILNDIGSLQHLLSFGYKFVPVDNYFQSSPLALAVYLGNQAAAILLAQHGVPFPSEDTNMLIGGLMGLRSSGIQEYYAAYYGHVAEFPLMGLDEFRNILRQFRDQMAAQNRRARLEL